MTSGDLLIAAPWLVFTAGLAVIGWRLIANRDRGRRAAAERPDACTQTGPDQPGPHPASPEASPAGRDHGR